MVEKNDNKKDFLDLKFIDDYIEKSKYTLEEEDSLLESFEILKICEDKILNCEIQWKNELKDHENEYDLFYQHPFVKQLKEDEELMFKCIENYKKINKRDPDSSSNGIENWYLKEDNLESLTICGKTTLGVSFLELIAIFYEFDLLQKSIKAFEELKVIKHDYPARLFTQVKVKIPVFQSREIILETLGGYHKKDKMLLGVLKSAKENSFEGFPKESENYTRIVMNFGFYFCKYIDDDNTELFTCFNINPKINSIPWLILNKFISDFGYNFTNDYKMIAENKEQKEEYSKRIKEKEIYKKAKKQLGLI